MPDRPVILSTLPDKVRPDRTALLVIDMSNDFVHPEGKTVQRANRKVDQARALIPGIQRLLEAARKANVLVVHVQHTTLRDHASDSGPWLDARSRATYSVEDVALEGTWGHQIIEELEPAGMDLVVQKYRYSGFAGTNLDLVLRSHRRESVVCVGVSTNVCVEATAREAFSNDYYVVIVPDACASWNQELHDATLESAAHRYATLGHVDEVVEVWEKHQ